MDLVTNLDGLQIMLQGLPSVGDFEAREATVNWNYEPILKTDKSAIESFKIDVSSIDMTYAYELEADQVSESSLESHLVLSSDKWSFDVTLNRMEDVTFVSVEIATISLDFEQKTVEVTINY
jgi:hypothetical protein